MTTLFRRSILQAALLFASIGVSSIALAQAPIVLKFSHVVAPDTPPKAKAPRGSRSWLSSGPTAK